ncbi:MAG: hypothetical protein ACRDLM_12240 [Gaiellaceae bacterium]
MISPAARARIVADYLEKGQAAGRAYLEHGTVPKPRRSPWSGPLIIRQAEAAWHRGFRKELDAQGAGRDLSQGETEK